MEQGRYMAATHVYDTAIEHVDKHDPLYDSIQTAKGVAMQEVDKRRDFICDFPMEISTRIIQQLFSDQQFDQQREYVMVSSAWWHRIIASNHLEYTMRPTLALDESNDMVIESFKHTRSLRVTLWDQPLHKPFQKYHFTRLTSLAIVGTYCI